VKPHAVAFLAPASATRSRNLNRWKNYTTVTAREASVPVKKMRQNQKNMEQIPDVTSVTEKARYLPFNAPQEGRWHHNIFLSKQ
jgi:hypothetical protein